MRIDGRNPAQHDLHLRVNAANGPRPGDRQLGKHLPVRVDLEIPVRQVVWLVPQHHRFNHVLSRPKCYSVPANSRSRMYCPSRCTRLGSQTQVSVSGCATISSPELRSMASAAATFGIHQFVGSSAYLFSMKYIAGKSKLLKISLFQK